MKAVVLEGMGQMACREVDVPVPGEGEALLRVRAASICGSDVARYTKGHRLYPLILGHEVSGEVVGVGPGADPGLVGMRAAMIPLIPCMNCEFCGQGLYSACAHYSFLGSRRDGGFAEYVALPASNLVSLPEGVDFESGALIEPATVARHALEMGCFMPGQSVAVLGAGSVGQMVVQWLHLLGAGKILVVDLSDDNLQCARRLGADVTIQARSEDVVRRLIEETGAGVDLALELAGAPQTLEQAIRAVRPRGAVVLTGSQPKEAVFAAELMETITRKELSVHGTWMSYSFPFPGHEWQEALAEMQSGRISAVEMVSHRFPLCEGDVVFQEIGARTLAYRKIMLIP
jgi:L-iditol 2-dehydrogenase